MNYKQKYLELKQKYNGGSKEISNSSSNIIETQITHDGRIFTLSDIHGDIHAFIIALRDCAKVIHKSTFNQTIIDPEIENMLSLDIKDDDSVLTSDRVKMVYDETLGYSWCGKNAYIVICGDIIDPVRLENCLKSDNTPCGFYPQIEIKLLRFINAINRQAIEAGGRIFKLLGNHEIRSIDFTSEHSDKYIYPRDNIENYYRNTNRKNIFNINNIGFDILFEDGCRLLIKINNTIFVHGQLPNNPITIGDIEQDNIFINEGNKDNTKWESLINKYMNYESSMLLMRDWANINDLNKRYIDNTIINFCNSKILLRIQEFMKLSNETDIKNLRVILGHCTQYDSTNKGYINSTFSKKILDDGIIKKYSQESIFTGESNISNQDTIFGITMQCSKKNNDHYVYHVDIGSARSFDNKYDLITDINSENKFLFSKTPQILLIDKDCDDNYNDILFIIKSKMKNTRIHLPRPNYEQMIRNKGLIDLYSTESSYDILI